MVCGHANCRSRQKGEIDSENCRATDDVSKRPSLYCSSRVLVRDAPRACALLWNNFSVDGRD